MAYILIVDDEESIRYTFRTFLVREGHEVATAATLAEAVSAMEARAPDLVFVDIILGGQSGLDLLSHIRDRGMDTEAIIITGEPSVESAAMAVHYQVHEYVSKPVNKEHLLNLTRVCLKHKALKDEKKLLEQEKERLRINLEAVFRSVPQAIITVDTKKCVIQANKPAQDLLGRSGGELMRRECAQVFGPYGGIFIPILDQILGQKKTVREFRIEGPDSESPPRTYVLNASPLLASDGGFMGAVLVVRDITRLADLERELTERRKYMRLIGKSTAMQKVYTLLDNLSSTDTTVLLTGSSGTGKELVGEALHHGGSRASGPLVKVNCSALSESLLESELFGHVRGAFTGAVRDKAGRFSLADTGTIFLDEIGDISPLIQLKLLRVLQEKEFERVGDATTIKVDVRVIAATNQNLRQKVRSGQFREDLYYRLKVVEITLPELRERSEDIPLLMEHFLSEFNRQLGKSITTVSDEVRQAFMNYSWPGNVRELRHAMEHAFILCRGDQIQLSDLPAEICSSKGRLIPKSESHLGPDAVADALIRAAGNKAKAARLLGVSRQTIYRKIREYSLVPESFEPS